MFGVITALAVAVFVGSRARETHKNGGRRGLAGSVVTTMVVSLIGGGVDVMSGTWRVIGIAAPTTFTSYALYFLGYLLVSLYLMFAIYFGRIVPITFRAMR